MKWKLVYSVCQTDARARRVCVVQSKAMPQRTFNLRSSFSHASTLMVGAIVVLAFAAFGSPAEWMAYVSGVLAAAAFVIGSCATGGARGEDGRFSSSKLQFIIWTTAFVFSLFAMLSRTLPAAGGTLPVNIPSYLLGAMGLSCLTLVGAKGIATSQVSQGRRPTSSDARASFEGGMGKGGFFTGEDGDTSLTKVQMLFFNALAAGVFVILTLRQLVDKPSATALSWPDIDPTLLMLCGIGNAGYVGRKLVPATDPVVASCSPALFTPGERVTIRGGNFGAASGMVVLDGIEIHVPAADWSPQAVTFDVPPARLDGADWLSDRTYTLVLERADGIAASVLEISFSQEPRINRVVPDGLLQPGMTVMIHGTQFGASPGAVLLNRQKLSPSSLDWKPSYLVFSVPSVQPSGAPWPVNPENFSLAVARADGQVTAAVIRSFKSA